MCSHVDEGYICLNMLEKHEEPCNLIQKKEHLCNIPIQVKLQTECF